MRFNYFDSAILGINITGQGSTNAVEGIHRSTLRHLVAMLVRRPWLRLASWRAFKCMPAMATPKLAICPGYVDARQTRQQRVGVTGTPVRGTVGVC